MKGGPGAGKVSTPSIPSSMTSVDVMASPERGHRAHPHVADVILEAWGPGLAACCEEAVAALVGVCFDAAAAEVVSRHPFVIDPGSDRAVLLDLLDEVVYVLDTSDDVPIRAEVTEHGRGLDVMLDLADRASKEVVGPAPKAISRSGLSVERVGVEVRCTFLVDV